MLDIIDLGGSATTAINRFCSSRIEIGVRGVVGVALVVRGVRLAR
jgi:hypothetical protein